MANRYRNSSTNANRFRMTACKLCGEQVSDRKSEAIPAGGKDHEYVIARDSNKHPITRKALPRQHRKGVGCRV